MDDNTSEWMVILEPRFINYHKGPCSTGKMMIMTEGCSTTIARREAYEILPMNNPLGYAWLTTIWRRSLRKGSWAKLSPTRKALIRCALWIAKTRGRISNTRLVTQVLHIAFQILGSFQIRIAAAGKQRAIRMSRIYNELGGVFSWAPQVREWLSDANYVFYLGVGTQS